VRAYVLCWRLWGVQRAAACALGCAFGAAVLDVRLQQVCCVDCPKPPIDSVFLGACCYSPLQLHVRQQTILTLLAIIALYSVIHTLALMLAPTAAHPLG
jgi:hypothetical protein